MAAKNVNAIVVQAIRLAGVVAQPMERLSSHGLRAGYATEDLMAGMPAQLVAQGQGRGSVESRQGCIRLSDPCESFLRIDLSPDENPLNAEAVVHGSIRAQSHRKHRRRRTEDAPRAGQSRDEGR